MRVLGLAAVAALVGTMAFVAPARAQMGGSDGPHINLMSDTPSKTQDELDAEAAQQKAYKESLKKIPDAKTSSDPWGAVRSEAPKSAPPKSTAATKTKKTGSNIPN